MPSRQFRRRALTPSANPRPRSTFGLLARNRACFATANVRFVRSATIGRKVGSAKAADARFNRSASLGQCPVSGRFPFRRTRAGKARLARNRCVSSATLMPPAARERSSPQRDAPRFLDTYIPLHSISRDPAAAPKRDIAIALLDAHDTALSLLVLQEFYVLATHATRPNALSHDIAAYADLAAFRGARNYFARHNWSAGDQGNLP
jgi:hypothetical protein